MTNILVYLWKYIQPSTPVHLSKLTVPITDQSRDITGHCWGCLRVIQTSAYEIHNDLWCVKEQIKDVIFTNSFKACWNTHLFKIWTNTLKKHTQKQTNK
jgi:hypothetical protein